MNANQVIDSLLQCTAGQIVACNVLAVPDGAGARSRRHWETAVDLQALDAAAASIDAWPERVTKESDGAVLGQGRFEFELLGSVPAPPNEAADTAFATRLAEGRTMAQVAQKLEDL